MLNRSLLVVLCCITSVCLKAQDDFYEVENPKLVYFCLRPGITIDHMKAMGIGAVSNLKFNSRRNSYISAGIDFDHDSLHGFIIRLEVAYMPLDFYGEGYDPQSKNIHNTYHLQTTTLTPELSLLYKIPNKRPFHIYGGVGLGWNASWNETSEWKSKYGNEEPIEFKDYVITYVNNWSSSMAAGFIYRNKWEFNCKLWFSRWASTNDYDLKRRPVTLTATYRL